MRVKSTLVLQESSVEYGGAQILGQINVSCTRYEAEQTKCLHCNHLHCPCTYIVSVISTASDGRLYKEKINTRRIRYEIGPIHVTLIIRRCVRYSSPRELFYERK